MTTPHTEFVTNISEAEVLGYFESISCVFLTKMLWLMQGSKFEDQELKFDNSIFSEQDLNELESIFPHDTFYKAVKKGNDEIRLNLIDDMASSGLVSAWLVFEQVIKHLTNPNYAESTDDLSVAYENNRFGFSKREKKDLELFYYMRNSMMHYNGAYYTGKQISHRYAGKDFDSKGHEGEKIESDVELTWKIIQDLEKYTIAAWQNFNRNAT